MNYKFAFAALLLPFAATVLSAQTASSLFLLSDSLQVKEIVSKDADMSKKVGHLGPAIENSHMALRISFNDRGAVGLYSKTGRGMELLKYGWYPPVDEDSCLGRDEYVTGTTAGFGGVSLWDGENDLMLVATKGRTARVGDSSKGSFAEVVSYGVPYNGDTLDVSVKIEVFAKSREARLTATELSGKKVRFVTGVNYHPGEKVVIGSNYTYVWGVHPSVDEENTNGPVGAGIKFNPKKFDQVSKTDDFIRLVSLPSANVSVTLVGVSAMEAELNSARRFEAYLGGK